MTLVVTDCSPFGGIVNPRYSGCVMWVAIGVFDDVTGDPATTGVDTYLFRNGAGLGGGGDFVDGYTVGFGGVIVGASIETWQAGLAPGVPSGPTFPTTWTLTPATCPVYIPSFALTDADSGNESASLEWEEPAVLDTRFPIRYTIYRSLSPAAPVTPVGQTYDLSFVDTGLTNGVMYRYMIEATQLRDFAHPGAPGPDPGLSNTLDVVPGFVGHVDLSRVRYRIGDSVDPGTPDAAPDGTIDLSVMRYRIGEPQADGVAASSIGLDEIRYRIGAPAE